MTFLFRAALLACVLVLPRIPAVHAEGTWTWYKNHCNKVRDIAVVGNDLWSVGRDGIVRWDTRTLEPEYFHIGSGVKIAVAPDSTLWINTGTLFAIKGTAIIHSTHGEKVTMRMDDMTVDRDGELWLTGGYPDLWLYTGEWNSLAAPPILEGQRKNIAVGQDYTVWIGCGAGLYRYSDEEWTVVSEEPFYSLVFSDDGTLWCGSYNVLLAYDGSGFTRYPLDGVPGERALEDLAFDSRGNIWAGGQDGVFMFDGSSWTPFTGFSQWVYPADVNLACGDDGSVWSFGNGGIFHYDGERAEIRFPYGLRTDIVRSVSFGEHGTRWFATDNGLYRMDGTEWTFFGDEDGLPAQDLSAVEVDADGTVWVGTSNHGLKRFRTGTWETFTTDDGLTSNAITTFAQAPDGILWIATNYGLTKFDGQVFTPYPYRLDILDIDIDTVGNVWCGTYSNGVFRFDGESWKQFTVEDGLPDWTVYSIDTEPHGIVWCGGRNGVGVYKKLRDWTPYTTRNSNLRGTKVTAVKMAPDGILWVGSNYGIECFDGESWWTANTLLDYTEVYEIDEDRYGTLWFVSSTGIYRYIPGEAGVAGSDVSPIEPVTLTGNYPNPFNASTTFTFSLSQPGAVTLDVYTITGQRIETLLDRHLDAGAHTVTWNGASNPSGVYLYRLSAGDVCRSGKMLLLR